MNKFRNAYISASICLAVLHSNPIMAKMERVELLMNPEPFILPDGDTTKKTVQQEDIVDVVKRIAGSKKAHEKDTTTLVSGKIYPSFLPAVGYTLTTSVTFILATNFSFYTSNPDSTNLSAFTLNPLYSIQNQLIVPLISNIWLKDNKINLQGSYRYYIYPSETYGLGGKRLLSDADTINYRYLSISQEALYHINHYIYGGVGYALDYHSNITESNNNSDLYIYSNGATHSLSSGALAILQYDSRTNINYPVDAFYGNVTYRDNLTAFGSDNNWQSVTLDIRKYIKLFHNPNDVLAFWSWDVFTFGKAPYLDLPSTGWDTYSNTGRGYIQGRFRGTDMVYLEGEYRFGITRNGLLGGVVFINAESVPDYPTNDFDVVHIGKGLGLRIKLNRYSNTNLCIDYGWGDGGSSGFFFNVGEVF